MSDLSQPLLATIDMGSNSFCLLITQYDPNENNVSNYRVITKIKRKVRLASGLNDQQILSKESIERGLDCLAWFAQTLKEIKPTHCICVATATLRLAKNNKDFVEKGEAILGHPIQILSGKEEANFIYQGASSGSNIKSKQLIIDIGGASTEVIIGQASTAIRLASLNIGCVTWLNQFFKQGHLTESCFDLAIDAAKRELKTIKASFLAEGWQVCLGASGTVQAIRELMHADRQTLNITQELLLELKQRIIQYEHLSRLKLEGLESDRAIVFPSGIAILLAVFSELKIESMQLANGALREGLLTSLANSITTK